MRVLWFTNTSSNYNAKNQTIIGGGWIASLEQSITNSPEIAELAIAFFHKKDDVKTTKNKVTYYPMPRKGRHSIISKFYYNWSHQVGLSEDLQRCISVVEDFKPDVIHVFGTENLFGLIAEYYPKKVIIHLQGLINPYLKAYFAPGVGYYDLLIHGNLCEHLVGIGRLHDYLRFKNLAKREEKIFQSCRLYMGRTEWDKSIVALMAPLAEYFYCGETLREEFYNDQWQFSDKNNLTITTTINSNLYKGLDVILKTASLLSKITEIPFIWNIYGIKASDSLVTLFERKLGIKFANNNVVFHGPQPSKVIVKALLGSDVFVHPSYIDNSPNSVCEAQLIGVPVIATNVGGVGSLIENKVSGYIVPANDPYAMAYDILNLKINKDIAVLLSLEARKIALARHDREKILATLLGIYHKIAIV